MNGLQVRQRAVALPSGAVQDASFRFDSPGSSVQTTDDGVVLSFASRRDVVAEVARVLSLRGASSREGAVVAGAVPFDAARLPHLRIHTKAPRTSRPDDARGAVPFVVQSPREVVMEPAPDVFMAAVAHAVERIQAGALAKVVLSRALDLRLSEALDVQGLYRRLGTQNPTAFLFRCDVSLPGAAERRTLIGASPELLVAKRGLEVASHPLAGSLPRSADASEDRARAELLLGSGKNQREHALVVEAVGDALAPYCRTLHVPRQPALVQTAAMWHLGTHVVGTLRDPEVSSLELALALHPTPAVGGVPHEGAVRAISELEPFDRGYFAGFVGHCDARGDGEWAVSIRCAEVSARRLRLYAGAGVVGASVPADELAETAAKLRTMLRALGFEKLVEAL